MRHAAQNEAERGHADCVMSIINLSEAYYRLVRVERRDEAESLWDRAPRYAPDIGEGATRR